MKLCTSTVTTFCIDKINGVVLDTRNWNIAEDDNTPNIIPKISIKLQTPDPYKKTPESPH